MSSEDVMLAAIERWASLLENAEREADIYRSRRNQAIVDYVSAGYSQTTAAAVAGIKRSNIYVILRNHTPEDEQGDGASSDEP